MNQHPHHVTTPNHDRRDGGYTLIELILVVLILGILTGAAVLTVSGMSAEAAETGCQADRRQLSVAAESYFAQRTTDTIPATGSGHDRFEQTLVDEQFLHSPSTFHDLDATGAVIPQENSSC